MSDLEMIWQRQYAFQRKIGHDFNSMTDEQRMAYIRQNALSLVSEVCEALTETGWKPWASSNHINHDKYADELIDAFHFLLNLFIAAGITSSEIVERFHIKNQINHQRQNEGYTGRKPECANCSTIVSTYWISDNKISAELARRNAEVTPYAELMVWCSDDCYNRWLASGPDDE